MANDENKWCPLSKEQCREDCGWADVVYDINDDGITRYINCSILLIAGSLLGSDIIIED